MMRFTRPARLGLAALAFIIVAGVLISLVVSAVRGNGGYQMAVHYPTAAGLAPGTQVFLNGVTIGSVRKVEILPDTSVEVIADIFSDTGIPKNAKFSVRSSLTGSPTVSITLPVRRVEQNVPTPVPSAEVWPKRVLPVSEQPVGSAPLSVEGVMAQSRLLGDRAQAALALARPYGKRLAYHLQNVRTNAGATSQELRTTLPAVMAGVQTTIAKAQAQMQDADSALRARDQPKIAAIAASFAKTSQDMQRSADALNSLERDPRLQSNLRSAAAQLRAASANMAQLSHDMDVITKNPQTKAQLRDAGARLHTILQQI